MSKTSNPYVPYSKSFGGYLREKRLKLNLSQAEVASSLEYPTNQVVSNWERGTQSPPFNKLLELCKVLKISKKEMVHKLLDEQKKIYNASISKRSKKA